MAAEIAGLRTQILANARIMLKTTATNPDPPASPALGGRKSPILPQPVQGSTSQWTLVADNSMHASSSLNKGAASPALQSNLPANNNNPSTTTNTNNDDLDVVIFGSPPSFTAAVIVGGLTPAVEGSSGGTPEGALRKLFLATCEMLNAYIPKVGAHQRNIHGGGVFDEDLVKAFVAAAAAGERDRRPSL